MSMRSWFSRVFTAPVLEPALLAEPIPGLSRRGFLIGAVATAFVPPALKSWPGFTPLPSRPIYTVPADLHIWGVTGPAMMTYNPFSNPLFEPSPEIWKFKWAEKHA